MSELTPDTMKPFTQYVCPTPGGSGLGHGSIWTGAWKGKRSAYEHKCPCGATYVEQVEDGLHVLKWEMVGPHDTDYHSVANEHRVLRDAEAQRDGLLELAAEGELIRNVELVSYTVTPKGG